MAWVYTAKVPAGELSALAADKPMLVAGNLLQASSVRWHTHNTGWSTAGTDEATGFPQERAVDQHTFAGTTADITAGEYSHSLDSGNTILSGSFDCIFIVFDPGVSSDASAITLQIQAADDDIYSVNVTNLHVDATLVSGSGTQRAFVLDLNTDSIVTGTGYVRFSISCGALVNFTTAPIIYEAVLGTRYQLSKKSNRPWDPEPMTSSIVRHVADSGAASRYVRNSGGYATNQTWQIDNQTGNAYSINDVDQFRNFWDKNNYGADSFVYCEDPSTSPGYARYVYTTAQSLSMPYEGPYERSVTLPMVEMPPFAGWVP